MRGQDNPSSTLFLHGPSSCFVELQVACALGVAGRPWLKPALRTPRRCRLDGPTAAARVPRDGSSASCAVLLLGLQPASAAWSRESRSLPFLTHVNQGLWLQGLRCLRSELPNLWCSELFTGPFNLAGSFAEVVQPANVRIGRWLHVVSVTAYRRPRSEQFVSGGNAAGRPSAVRRGRARGARRDGGRVLQLMAGLPVGTPRPYPVSKAALRPALARR